MQRNILYIVLSCLLIFGCEKNDINVSPSHIIAGNTDNNVPYYVNYNDSIEYEFLPDGLSYCQSNSDPFSIDKDDEFEIRAGHHWCTSDSSVNIRYFFLSNNYGNDKNIEFSIGNMVKTPNKDTILLLKIYKQGDSINQNSQWIQSDDISPYHLSYYYNITKQVNHEVGFLSINQNIREIYIGIRKKVDNIYVYGWLQLSIFDSMLVITNSCFTR